MDARQKMAMKNMRFNRYIMLRYALALFFFANLNWMVFSLPGRNLTILLPVVMIFLALFSIHEFIVLYSSSQKITLKKTKLYFLSQLIMNSLLIVFSFHSGFYSLVFPFLNDSSQGRTAIVSLLALGLLISGLCLKKLQAIAKNKDRGYRLFNNFKQSMKVSESYGE